ncbi:MAG: tRNA (adenosine(37)-N6)-threonylcarbamoyltransferase complex ATPase subunit type 1 TsaE [Planctomycetaceae bacterium]|jgi:tRNA threonylcarbamoyladenosine biosynthesis protein TsaE
MATAPDSQFPTIILDSQEEAETLALGQRLAGALEPGLVVALQGNLGAGKTRLVKGIAAGAGVDPREVTSPTFVLVNEYSGRWPIYHFDTYRLTSGVAFAELGIDEYFAGDGISLVEWADRVPDWLPPDRLEVTIEVTGEQARRLTIRGLGPRAAEVVRRLNATPLNNDRLPSG